MPGKKWRETPRHNNPFLKYFQEDGYVRVITRKGHEVLLDSMADVELANQGWGWSLIKEYIKVRLVDRSRCGLHRLIMNAGEGTIVDHINSNKLDNRRINLRFCTAGQNVMNAGPRKKHVDPRNPYKGVRRDKRIPEHKKSWNAILKANRMTYSGVPRHTPEEAARDYDELAKIHHGEFANLNFPAVWAVIDSETEKGKR